jgi:squalene cyclase
MNKNTFLFFILIFCAGCFGFDSNQIEKTDLKKSMNRGLEFLFENQNKDGSWSHSGYRGGILLYVPAPTGHQSFKAGCTALCVLALLEVGDFKEKRTVEALARAQTWLERKLPLLRRQKPEPGYGRFSSQYNVWGHGYGLQALAALMVYHKDNAGQKEKLLKLMQQQIFFLKRMQFVRGGWSYLDFSAITPHPTDDPTPFTTATVLVALKKAREQGAEVPEKMIQRAIRSILKQRNPDSTYKYSYGHRPTSAINHLGASLGRSQVCNYALKIWGQEVITEEVLNTWLNNLAEQNGWLDVGRKKTIPHESFLHISGYFYYYGHYYGALCLEEVSKKDREKLKAPLANHILRLQERDGSWWDYPCYGYHQYYGTAMALMTLKRYLPEPKPGK